MAKGKNQKVSKRGNAAKRMEKHPFLKKKWYKLISPPTVGNSVMVGYTPVNKTMGTSNFITSQFSHFFPFFHITSANTTAEHIRNYKI